MIKKTKQKLILVSLEKEIKKYQKHLQLKENIKKGRKARSISFVDACKPKDLANFILGGSK